MLRIINGNGSRIVAGIGPALDRMKGWTSNRESLKGQWGIAEG